MSNIDRRTVLAAGMVFALPRPLAAQRAPLHPEDFGAKGDGANDDTLAFQALGKAVSDAGGGAIVLRRGATYRIGRQTHAPVGDGPAYLQQPMLRITGAQGVTILGQGATIKLNDGLRYGSFDPATGARFDPPEGKFTDPRYAASVGALIELRSCGRVRIENVTLDGNVDRLVVGGRWNVDIQLHADGLQLIDVSAVTVENVTARNNGLDGVYLRGRGKASSDVAPPDDIRFTALRCARNGRQGVSVVGGRGIRFTGCTFADTGQGPVSSAPSAGVDIEPNGRDWASDIGFDACTFINNRGVGLVAAQGASRGIVVRNCTFWQGFVGGRGGGDAFWLTKEDVAIGGCRVHGNVTNLAESATVTGTSFDDATHPVHGRSAQRRKYLLADARGTFTDCSFTLRGPGPQALVYATKPTTFRRCVMRYAGTGLDANTPVAFLSAAVTLEDVTFAEAPGRGGALFIHADRPTLKGRVVVTGPRIHWGGKTGRTGNVAAPPQR